MIIIHNIRVYNVANAIYSARNPMNSWHISDSDLENDIVGKRDLELAHSLYIAGPEHRKFMRQIFVSMDITAPLYFYKQFDTYKVGVVTNSCSTMHKIADKEFTIDDFSHEHLMNGARAVLDDVIGILNFYRKEYLDKKTKDLWWQMIQLLPSSYNQKRTVTMNYENAVTIINQRTGHKLNEWNDFTTTLFDLPYMAEIIEG